MANTVTFGTVASLVVQGLNLASTYTPTPDDPRVYAQGVLDAINASDVAVVETILGNAMHPRRSQFFTSSPVAHEGQIPNHIGPVVSIEVNSKGATAWPKTEIEYERTNDLSLTFDGHYWVDSEGILYHNGTGNATVFYCTISATASPTTASLLQSPDEYFEAVASKTLSFLFNIEGENSAAAEFYDNHWRAFENSIRGARAMPEFDLFMPQPQG